MSATIFNLSDNFDCSLDLFTMAAAVAVAGLAIAAFLFLSRGKEEGPKPGGVSSVTMSNSVTVTRAGTTTRKKFATIRFRKE